uniref:Protein 4.1 n=1 Tax=Anthurium amnicola TaxID=1678845 RepID=A0A1D1XPD1_9ARAE
MGADSAPSPRGVLEGVHGVRLVTHSPFRAENIFQNGEFKPSCEGPGVSVTNQSLVIQRIWQQRPSCLRPIHCNLQGDQNLAETIANVITSLPFIALGLQAPSVFQEH